LPWKEHAPVDPCRDTADILLEAHGRDSAPYIHRALMWYYPKTFPHPRLAGDREFILSFDDTKDIDKVVSLLRL
jgi:hypothetical protein